MKLGNNKINKKSNPFDLFNEWYEEAKRKEIKNPNAMALSTIDSFNRPRTRMVLMKEIKKKGIVFYTNSQSYKGKQIDKNKNASLCFYWKSLGKQIIIQGKVNKINEIESDKYFHSRDKKSKIGAWASDQSKVLKSRLILEKKYNFFFNKFSGKEVPRPNYWNGYCVEPRTFEFWLERQNRLHERVEYNLNKNKWSRRFLYP